MKTKKAILITSPRQHSIDRDQAEAGARLMAYANDWGFKHLSSCYDTLPGLYLNGILKVGFGILRDAGQQRFAEEGVPFEKSAVLARFRSEAEGQPK